MTKQVIVLAGGKGKRMQVSTAKCAYQVNGIPMISRICKEIDKNNFQKKIIVVGDKKEEIIDLIPKDYLIAYQTIQLGTADAVKCAIPFLEEGIVLIIPGDMPYINNELLDEIIAFHNNNDITIVSNIINNPFGYGRIVRKNNKIVIIEEKDAKESEKQIKEVNSGILLIDTRLLKNLIAKITNNNSQHEYYLTDIVNISSDAKIGILTYENDNRLRGINKKEDII